MARKAREELKKLESMRATLEAEIGAMTLEEKALKQDISSKKQVLNQIKQKINKLSTNNSDLTVSEHAILRYFERVLGIDIDKVAEAILPEEEAKLIENLGNGTYPIKDGAFKILIKDGVVVTVLVD